MNRKELARQAQVSPRMLADAVFILNNAPQDVIDRIHAGTLTIQEAMRMLGKVTQRDRNRQRAAMVLSLCNAVLDGDQQRAEQLAVQLLPRKPSAMAERITSNL